MTTTKPSAAESNRAWGKRYDELLADPHILAQCERLMPVLSLIDGSRNVRSLAAVQHDVVVAIMALEANPDSTQTHGSLVVERGPMDGYSVLVRATDIYFMQMADFARKRRESLS